MLRYVLGMIYTYGKGTKPYKDSRVRPIELYMYSLVQRMGYTGGFKGLPQFLSQFFILFNEKNVLKNHSMVDQQFY